MIFALSSFTLNPDNEIINLRNTCNKLNLLSHCDLIVSALDSRSSNLGSSSGGVLNKTLKWVPVPASKCWGCGRGGVPGVSLSFCAGGQWGFSARHFLFFL